MPNSWGWGAAYESHSLERKCSQKMEKERYIWMNLELNSFLSSMAVMEYMF